MFYVWIMELLEDHTDNWSDHIGALAHQIMSHKGKKLYNSFRRWFDV